MKIAHEHQFLLFEDRKFADIGSTVKAQYRGGSVRAVEWADIVTAHGVAGPGTLEGLKQAVDMVNATGDGVIERGVLLVAEMSSEGNLAKGKYTEGTVLINIGVFCLDRPALFGLFLGR